MQQPGTWTGERIRRLRDDAGFTQRDLAELLQVHVKTAAAAERGAKPLPSRCEPWLWVLKQAAAAYEPLRVEALEVAAARAEDEVRDLVEPPRLFGYLKVRGAGAHEAVLGRWYAALRLAVGGEQARW